MIVPERLREFLLNSFFPESIYCIACGNLIDGSRLYSLCDRCRKETDWRLGTLSTGQTGGVYFCASYSGWAKRAVREMKYKGKPYIAKHIADMMADRAAGEDEILSADVIVSVPMHKKKRLQRGYNQTELICERLASRLDIPYDADILKKLRHTESLSIKSGDERRVMLADAFSVSVSPAGRHILLVDDVFTTGSTTAACTDALMSTGAASVTVFVFASGAIDAPV